MKQYIVKSGQNLYDVALTLYGSIEGVFDLLINNRSINLNSQLTNGQILYYNEGFMVNQTIVDWFKTNGDVIKNGCKEAGIFSIADKIAEFISSQNEAVIDDLKNSRLKLPYGEGNPTKPFDPFGNKTKEYDEFEVYDLYSAPLQQISTAINGIIDFQEFTGFGIRHCVQILFEDGLILLPSDDMEQDVYISSLAVPKIIVFHTGNASSFEINVRHNKLVAVDWGDNSGMDYAWYSSDNQKLSHRYSDSGSHVIKIYGNAEYVELDFSNICGTYYALTPIHVEDKFTTPFPDAENINRLFIVNG